MSIDGDDEHDRRIPVTVLTGYLGAGKTTLLNRILSEPHGRRYAVLVNEFGEIGIDAELIVGADEELFEMNNGCVCCTVRGDLIRMLHTLLAGNAARAKPFDAIVVETTGLADPAPVAQTFLADALLQSRTRLDSITTVVDARHIAARLADSAEAAAQIAFADQIVLNKTDLVTPDELDAVQARLRRLNPLAPIHRAVRSQVALADVLERGGFDLARIDAAAPDDDGHGNAHRHDADCGHDHDHDHDQAASRANADHARDAGIESVSLQSHVPMDRDAIEAWLTALLAAQGDRILRAKGIVAVRDDPRRLVFQAVHRLLEGDWQRPWRDGEARTSRLVFIGRGLDAAALRAGFDACAAGASAA